MISVRNRAILSRPTKRRQWSSVASLRHQNDEKRKNDKSNFKSFQKFSVIHDNHRTPSIEAGTTEALMARGIHGLPKVSPGPAMSDPSTPCGPYGRFEGRLRPSSTPLDTPQRTSLEPLNTEVERLYLNQI
jgi:hypothetical protein